MARQFVALPVEGAPTQHKPKQYDKPVPARMFVQGVVLEPGDAPIPGSTTYGAFKRRYLNAATNLLVIRVGQQNFTVNPLDLGVLTDESEIALRLQIVPA